LSQVLPAVASYSAFIGMDSTDLAASACRGGNTSYAALSCLSEALMSDSWDLSKAALDCRAGVTSRAAQRCREQVRVKLGDVPGIEDALCGYGRKSP
jgi:glutamine synthetase type III